MGNNIKILLTLKGFINHYDSVPVTTSFRTIKLTLRRVNKITFYTSNWIPRETLTNLKWKSSPSRGPFPFPWLYGSAFEQSGQLQCSAYDKAIIICNFADKINAPRMNEPPLPASSADDGRHAKKCTCSKIIPKKSVPTTRTMVCYACVYHNDFCPGKKRNNWP